MREALTIVLEGVCAPSWNLATARKHWTEFVKVNHEAKWLVLAALNGDDEMFDTRVDIEVIASYKQGMGADSDNIMAKVYIDALKGRIIHDDGQKYVRRVILEARKGKNEVVITVTPVEE